MIIKNIKKFRRSKTDRSSLLCAPLRALIQSIPCKFLFLFFNFFLLDNVVSVSDLKCQDVQNAVSYGQLFISSWSWFLLKMIQTISFDDSRTCCEIILLRNHQIPFLPLSMISRDRNSNLTSVIEDNAFNTNRYMFDWTNVTN